MNIWKIAKAAFIIVMLVILWRLEKKDKDQTRRVLANAFDWTIGMATPFALIELLSAFGLRLFDVPWALTPLDVMSYAAMMALLVLSGKKLLGFIPQQY